MGLTLEEVLIESPRYRAADMTFRAPEGSSMAGEADILVAIFDEPDTGVPHGLKSRQVIEQGAFRAPIASGKLGKRPYLMDHGDATITGYVNSEKVIGYADGWAEDAKGLRMTGHYNLKTPMGDLAWNQANFESSIPEYSFRWPADEKVTVREGVEYVSEFSDVQEASQVTFGANSRTGILTLRAAKELVARENGSADALLPTATVLKAWLGQDAFRALMRSVMTDDDELLKTITAGIDQAVTEERILGVLATDHALAERVKGNIEGLLKDPEPPARALTPAERGWYERLFA